MGRRVELKTSQLRFSAANGAWRVAFHKVKLARDGCRAKQPFDDLYLLIYAPDGFYLIKHDLKTGVAKAGVRTAIHGHSVKVYAKEGQTCWREGLQTILDKMTLRGCCDLVAYIPKSDALAQALHTEIRSKESSHAGYSFYQGVPLFTVSSSTRSQRVQAIAYELDKLQHPNSIFHSAQGEVLRGITRGNSNAAVDWVRDGVRVEVKSAMLCRRAETWMCDFRNIKVGKTAAGTNAYFDELWLAIYHPSGIDFFKHWNWRDNLQCAGKGTSIEGKKMVVTAGTQHRAPSSALEGIKAKLEADGAVHQFTVRWAAAHS